MVKLIGVITLITFITIAGICDACVTQTGPDTYTVDSHGYVDF